VRGREACCAGSIQALERKKALDEAKAKRREAELAAEQGNTRGAEERRQAELAAAAEALARRRADRPGPAPERAALVSSTFHRSAGRDGPGCCGGLRFRAGSARRRSKHGGASR
jgi:hypothetical protein